MLPAFHRSMVYVSCFPLLCSANSDPGVKAASVSSCIFYSCLACTAYQSFLFGEEYGMVGHQATTMTKSHSLTDHLILKGLAYATDWRDRQVASFHAGMDSIFKTAPKVGVEEEGYLHHGGPLFRPERVWRWHAGSSCSLFREAATFTWLSNPCKFQVPRIEKNEDLWKGGIRTQMQSQ